MDLSSSEYLLNEFITLQNVINRAGSAEEGFNLMLNALLRLTGSKYGYIAKITDTHLAFRAVVMDDWGNRSNTQKPRQLTLESMDTLFGMSANSNKVIISDDTMTDPRRGGKSKLPHGHPPIHTFIAIPLICEGIVRGQLAFANSDTPYDPTLPEQLSVFINQIISMMAANNMRNELKELRNKSDLNKTKNLLMANVSHEIRTPLSAIMGMLSLLEDTEVDDIQWEYITMMRKSTEDLLILINDILDISKLEAGEMSLSPTATNMEKCIEECYDMVGPDSKKKKLTMSYEIDEGVPHNVIIDRNRLKQMLKNLLSNAVKFTNFGSIVTKVENATSEEVLRLNLSPLDQIKLSHSGDSLTSLGVESKSDLGAWRYIKFSVIDTGIGIKQQDRVRLFKSFTQLDSSSTKSHGGTGLGLSITYQLCDLMEGHISVVSDFGKGSTFYFIIPMQEHFSADDDEISLEFIRGKNFLVVDDNSRNLITLCNTLDKWGVSYRECESGQRAYLSYVDNSRYNFDLGLIDIVMPDMDGNELAEKISQSGNAFPMIALSSLSQNADDISNNFAASLYKPYSAHQLLGTIVNVLKATAIVDSSDDPSDEESASRESPTSKITKEWTLQKSNLKSMVDSAKTKILHKKPSYARATYPDAKILVVEDKDENLIMLCEMLKKIGYTNVDAARNGKEAVEKVRQVKRGYKKYDIILMDILMPEMDGMEASKIITKMYRRRTERPKIVAVTARVVEGAEHEYLRDAHMDDIIYKPIKDIHMVAHCLEKNLSHM